MALASVRADIPQTKREIGYAEAVALYHLARQHDGGAFLEIGTAYGFSAAVLALAAPNARIVTLNPKDTEYPRAKENLAQYENVIVRKAKSWDHLDGYQGPYLDLVFVDGDHGQVARDFAWWNWLKAGGLMLFHDYAPEGDSRPCQPVYEALNALRDALCRDFDVRYQSLAGWYKQKQETLPVLAVGSLLWDYDTDVGWHKLP